MGCAGNKAIRPSKMTEDILAGIKTAEASKSLRGISEGKIILNNYVLALGADGILGEGAWSICRQGMDARTRKPVAIKLYKKAMNMERQSKDGEIKPEEEINEIKFQRQVKVLRHLQKPFNPDHFAGAGKARILKSNPASMFVQLFDFSPSECLEKYIVTEAGQCTLKSMLQKHLAAKQALKKDQVRCIAQAVVLAAGGLHEKGLVHLDIKPENVMLFGDCWKLIDVDGSTRIGESVSCTDTTLSFSPCYCAPEWATFSVSKDRRATMRISTSLDSWSVGMTLAALIVLDSPLKPIFNKMLADTGLPHRRSAMTKFLNHIGHLENVPLPRSVDRFNADFARMIRLGLLAFVPSRRLTMAEALEDRFMQPFVYKPPMRKTFAQQKITIETSAVLNSKTTLPEFGMSCNSQATTKYTSPPGSVVDASDSS